MIRIGVVGAGPNAKGHATYFANSPRSKVVAVADPVTERAEALASPIGARACASIAELIDDVDAVVISSPNFLHTEHAVLTARAGKHVYCEKPMGLRLEEAETITRAVADAGVKSVVGFSPRFSPPLQTLERLVADGELGELISVWSRRLTYLDPAKTPGWRADHSLSGGLLLEINIHELDWMMRVGGDVRSVYALTRAQRQTSPRSNDHLWITLAFENGAVGTHEGSWLCPGANYYRGAYGTRAVAATNEWGSGLLVNRIGENRAERELAPAFDLRGHFLDCIEHDAAPVADVHWALKVMTVAEAVYKSAETGQAVTPGSLAELPAASV